MKTKEQILDRNGFDFEAFKFENEYSADNILSAMEEYADQKVEQLTTTNRLLVLIEQRFGPGCAAICKERKRQIEAEGWVPEHDDSHVCGELTDAAICYIMRGYWRRRGWIQMFWPWLCDWWKPTPDNRQRELEKGGALTAAEIDRLKRKEENK